VIKAIRRIYCIKCELKTNNRNGSITAHFEGLSNPYQKKTEEGGEVRPSKKVPSYI